MDILMMKTSQSALDEDKAIRDEKRIERVNCFNWQDSANAMFSKYIEVVGNN